MNPRNRRRARKIVRILAPDDYERLAEIRIQESDFGFDPLGLERGYHSLTSFSQAGTDFLHHCERNPGCLAQ